MSIDKFNKKHKKYSIESNYKKILKDMIKSNKFFHEVSVCFYTDEYNFYDEEYEYIYNRIKELNGVYEKNRFYINMDDGGVKNISNGQVISNFFIEPVCFVDFYNQYYILEKRVLLRVFSIKESLMTSVLIKVNELDNINWISSYLNTAKYQLLNEHEYRNLKNSIKLSIKQIERDKIIHIKDFSGWRRGRKKWKYKFLNKQNIKRIQKLIVQNYNNDSKAIFSNTVELINSAIHKEISIPLISFLSLSLVKELLKDKGIEPNFVLLLTGKKETGLIRIGELVANIFHYEEMPKNNIYSLGYISDSVSMLQRKAATFKDSLFVIDGISSGKQQNLNRTIDNFLVNYYTITDYNKNAEKNNKYMLNRLCLLLNEGIIENNLYYNIYIDKENINIDGLNILFENKEIITSFFYIMLNYIMSEVNNTDKKYLADIKVTFKKYKRHFLNSDVTVDERMSDILSFLLLGYKLIIDFGVAIDSISEEDSKELLNEAICILKKETKFNDGSLEYKDEASSKGVEAFIKIIHELYNSDSVNLFPRYKKDVLNGECIGWIKNTKLKNKETGISEPTEEILFNERSIIYLNKYIKELNLIEMNFIYDNLKKELFNMKISRGGNEESHCGLSRVENKRYIAIPIDNLKRYIGTMGTWEEGNLGR
jgi:hypothetical protein